MQRKELGVWRHGVYIIIIIIFNITIYYNYIPFLHGGSRHTVALFCKCKCKCKKKCKGLPIDQDKNPARWWLGKDDDFIRLSAIISSLFGSMCFPEISLVGLLIFLYMLDVKCVCNYLQILVFFG